jgi:hypothetical protein
MSLVQLEHQLRHRTTRIVDVEVDYGGMGRCSWIEEKSRQRRRSSHQDLVLISHTGQACTCTRTYVHMHGRMAL